MNIPVLVASARANRSHTREDLLKKESRVNLTLFGALGIPEFWKPLCHLLQISPILAYQGGHLRYGQSTGLYSNGVGLIQAALKSKLAAQY